MREITRFAKPGLIVEDRDAGITVGGKLLGAQRLHCKNRPGIRNISQNHPSELIIFLADLGGQNLTCG